MSTLGNMSKDVVEKYIQNQYKKDVDTERAAIPPRD